MRQLFEGGTFYKGSVLCEEEKSCVICTSFAFDTFDEDAVRRDIEEKLQILKNCNVEIIIKDVSTVRYKPERLWR